MKSTAMNRVKDYARFLVDNGLLFEMNRKVLHPLGYELVIDIDPDDRRRLVVYGLNEVKNDPEGIIYDAETLDANRLRYEEYLKREGQNKIDSRKRILGYVVQGDEDESQVSG